MSEIIKTKYGGTWKLEHPATPGDSYHLCKEEKDMRGKKEVVRYISHYSSPSREQIDKYLLAWDGMH